MAVWWKRKTKRMSGEQKRQLMAVGERVVWCLGLVFGNVFGGMRQKKKHGKADRKG
ncbi:MAG: hypothetical protein ACLTN0_06125 [Coprococcus phoceensis]